MQFQVPQFIDIAPKVVGPLTIRQFLYLAAGAVPTFLLFFVLKFWLWTILAVLLCGSGLILAFGKFNGQPLPRVAFSIFNYFWRPRFYLWRHVEEPITFPSLPKLPEFEKTVLTEKIEPSRVRSILEKMATAPTAPLKDLLLKITTSRHPIEKREKKTVKFLDAFDIPEENYESIRKIAGDRGVARRIDYR